MPSIQFLCDTLPKEICQADKDSLTFRTNNRFQMTITKGNSIVFKRPLNKDVFLKGFFTGLLFRNSCYSCRYACNERVSDITIADFWGWEKTNPNFNKDNKGCSLVLLNTEKGCKLFEAIKDRLNTIPANFI